MGQEDYSPIKNKPINDTSVTTVNEIVNSFRELTLENIESSHIFQDLEDKLLSSGFEHATSTRVSKTLQANHLFCRNESLKRVLDLISNNEPIHIANNENQANMCTVSSGNGFKKAMVEGFSADEVNNAVKVVITYSGNHLEKNSVIPKDSELWKIKPDTAEVSVVGSGEIRKNDLEMISFRFPLHLFPKHFLTEDEEEKLEDAGIRFIVRHYTQT